MTVALLTCEWTTDQVGSHAGYHHGYPCPVDRIAALEQGQPDPAGAVAEWRVDLPFVDGKPPMSLNDRSGHWAIRAKQVEKVKAITRNAVIAADVPQLGAVHVELHYRGKTNAVRDADNYVATLKVCIDALHHKDPLLGDRWQPILQGDDARYVSWSQPFLHPAIKSAGAATWLILRTSTGPDAVQEALL